MLIDKEGSLKDFPPSFKGFRLILQISIKLYAIFHALFVYHHSQVL